MRFQPLTSRATRRATRDRGLYLAQGRLMCSTIKDFDVHARGVINLVKSWKTEHAAVRAVWKLEDLTSEWLRLSEKAHDLQRYYCEHGEFPNLSATYSYFVDIVGDAVGCGRELDDLISMFEGEGHSVEGADRLRREIDRLQEIINEDRFATNASFGGGVLDDWD